ncbi:hypothetical protein A3I18_01075 [Candidatus Campbellbacteria bacterium RIFCSPLOWO2_02_FULL_35_11]|uniref:Uncharacterized protein n=1 Tax=Candidatus Campbellbacteria bacterium RIFCSPLOWO2_02_FULL_35_11 TaxID=1797581 RepID=A0A1F5EQL3_9BACT|nr:MAG: hypothetical protein A3I18_01075 [Candidatus Campbellbacteria bacterium RIFCSPLOWO2_02_FULL_35_11]
MKKLVSLVLLGLVVSLVPISASAVIGNLVVEQIAQPVSVLAPEGAARLPFTRIRFKAVGGVVPIYGLEVEQTGSASTNVFAGVAYTCNNIQAGTTKVFGSGNRLMLGTDSALEIASGTTCDITVVGNMANDLDDEDGTSVSLSIVGVWTTSAISGFSWTDGATHVINSVYEIGTVAVTPSASNPPNNGQVEIGSASIFSSLKITAGSDEDQLLKSVTTKMTGTAIGYLKNVRLIVGSSSYPMTALPDGRYYVGGLNRTIGEDDFVVISVSAEVTGGVGFTVEFDIVEATDLELFGKTTGFGPTPTGSGAGFGGTPWFKGSVTQIVPKPEPPPPPPPLPPPTEAQKKARAMTAIRSLLLD